MSTSTHTSVSDIPTQVGQSRTYHLGGAWSVQDANNRHSSVRCLTFAQIVRIYLKVLYTAQSQASTPLGGHYPSDLYHDATSLQDRVLEDAQTFHLECDAWGTFVFWPLPDGTYPDGYRETRFACTLYAAEAPYEARDWYLHVECVRWRLRDATPFQD